MKKPFAVTGIFSLLISLLALNSNTVTFTAVSICITAAAVICAALCKKSFFKNTNIAVAGVSIILVLISAACTANWFYSPTSFLDESEADIKATLVSEPQNNGDSTLYTFEASHPVNGRRFRFIAWSYENELDIGDKVNVTVRFKELTGTYSKSNMSEGVYIAADIKSVNSVVKNGSGFYSMLGRIRLFIKYKILTAVDGDLGAVPVALLTGDRSFISDELYSRTKTCGVTHILVVSGLHLGILCGVIMRLFRKIRLGQRVTVFIIFLLFTAVVAICDFHTSAVRAAVMSIIMLSGSLISRRADPVNSLGFAVTVMTLFNPYIAGNIAFLLSVFSTFGVIYLAPKLIFLTEDLRFECRGSRLLNKAVDTVIVSVSALVCVFPITIAFYGYTSLLSPIVTVFIGASVELALISAAAGVLLSALPVLYIFSTPIIYISAAVSGYINAVIHFFGRNNTFVLVIDPAYAPLCFLISAAAVFTVWIFYTRKLKKQKEQNEHATERKGTENGT